MRVAYYRLYFLSARTGHIHRFEEFDALGDDAALSFAEKHSCGDALELWSGKRKVGTIGANDAASRVSARRSEQREGTYALAATGAN